MKQKLQYTDDTQTEFKKYLESKRYHRYQLVGGVIIKGRTLPEHIKTLSDFHSTESIDQSIEKLDDAIDFIIERLEPRTFLFEGSRGFSNHGWYYRPIVEVEENTDILSLWKQIILKAPSEASIIHTIEIKRSYFAADPYSGARKHSDTELHDKVSIRYLIK